MVVLYTDLKPNLTQAETDELVNNLLLGETGFAEYSCLQGQAFGVETFCPSCEEYATFMNDCVRGHIIKNLVAAQETAERELNYALTPRYETYYRKWDGCSRIRLNPGIEALGIQLEISDQSPPVSESVVYPLIESVPLTDSGDGYCIATLDGTVVSNPNKIVFRDQTSNEVIEIQDRTGFPRKVAGDWQVALGNKELPPCAGTIDAYHCELVRVVTPETTVADGYIAPVYPGTNQKIHQALPSELIDGDTNRVYWFYVYSLLDPAFQDEGADLVKGEYYKLIETIEFKQFVETTAEVLIEYTEPSSETEGDFVKTEVAAVGFEIISAETGVVEIYPDPKQLCDCNHCYCGRCKWITGITIPYKTNPSVLSIDGNILDVCDAIAHLAASELPLSSCDCDITDLRDKRKSNFIIKAQEAYTEVRINPISGEMVQNLRHGNLYGQLVFTEKIGRLPVVPKVSYM